ncbi:MAG: hypothetical protein P8183_14580 [Anaerolineae bacterium]
MTRQLTQRQKSLLYQLVEQQQCGQLREPFGLVPTGPSEYVIYLFSKPSMRLNWICDLDALCVLGYLEYRWNRLSNARLYRISKAAKLAFKSGELAFVSPEKQLPTKNGHFDKFRANPPTDRLSLLRKAESVRVVLKHELGTILQGIALGDAIAEVIIIQDLYYMVTPNTTTLFQTLSQLGQRITTQIAAAETFAEKTAVTHTLATFSSWSYLISQLPFK